MTSGQEPKGKVVLLASPRIVIELYPNELRRTFHVNARISSEKLFDSIPGLQGLQLEMNDVSHDVIQTALEFYEIDGVTGVNLDTYEVGIGISRAFDWEEVTPQVIERVKKLLQWDDCEVREHDSRPVYERSRSMAGVPGLWQIPMFDENFLNFEDEDPEDPEE